MKKAKEPEMREGVLRHDFPEDETPTAAETPIAKSTPPKGIAAVRPNPIDASGGFRFSATAPSADATVAVIQTTLTRMVAAVRGGEIPSGKLTIEVLP